MANKTAFYLMSYAEVEKRYFSGFTEEGMFDEDERAARALADVDTTDLKRFILKQLYMHFLSEDSGPDRMGVYRACARALYARVGPGEAFQHSSPETDGYDLVDRLPEFEVYVQRSLGDEENSRIYTIAMSEMRRAKLDKRTRARFSHLEMIPSNLIYQFAQRAIARAPEGIFDSLNEGFPAYTEKKNGFNASLEMRPSDDLPYPLMSNYTSILQSMSEKLSSLGDVAVDVMDIIFARHLQNDDETITITTDEILAARGVKPKVKDGYSAGYRPEEKKAVVSIMNAMDNLWIVVGEMEIHIKGRSRPRRYREKSRLMMITGIAEQTGMDAEGFYPVVWRIRLGEVFETLMKGDAATQYALLSSKTLQYDPYRQKWEKRLSRYFHPLWRIRQSGGSYTQPFRVATLLDAVGSGVDRNNPQKTKERLEAALDRLAQDRVISGWQYGIDASEEGIGKRGWVDRWLEWRVIVEPSMDIMEKYNKIKMMALPTKAKAERGDEVDLMMLRKKFGVTQLQLSEELGVSRSLIAQIERGTRAMSAQVKEKVSAWAQKREMGVEA